MHQPFLRKKLLASFNSYIYRTLPKERTVCVGDPDMEFLHQLIMGMFAFFISYHVVFKRMKRSKGKIMRKAPEPGYSWPIIGHLHLLKGPEPFHHKLSAMADKLGPVFMLRLGAQYRTLVVSGSEAIKECFTSKDRALASRPCTAAGEYMCYNHLMFSVAPYGSYWREVRKMSMIHLLSNHRLEMLKHVRATEIDERTKGLYRGWVENDGCPVKVEMKQWLHDLNFSIAWKMVVGKRCVGVGEDDEGKELQRLTVEFFRLFMAFVVSDAFPFLKLVDWMGKKKRTMKKIAKKMDSIIGKLLKEHRCRRARGDKGEEGGFMDVMLSIMEDSPLPGHDTDTVIKATTLAIILSATDTTATTLAGALSAVLNNPQVLKKAQDELDTHVGRNRHVDESDIKSLTYLQAIIKETLRMGPTGLLLPVHEATDDCKIGGFYVPAGTRVLVDMGKVHHDPLIWSDPDKFWPERWFLTMHRDVDVRGQQFEYLPFGSGRRSCPGISFAMQVMHLSLARLIHGFEMEVPVDAPYIDVRESLRLDNPKSTPVEVLFTPRLPSHLYED